jgi:hypothetical protein
MDRDQYQHNMLCRQQAEEMISFIGEKPRRFWECLAGMVNAKLSVGQPAPATQPPATSKFGRNISPPDDSPERGVRVRRAIELCDEIDEMANEVPEPGFDFAESVRERAKAIGETVERLGRVTDAQTQALLNMRDGLAAWLHD